MRGHELAGHSVNSPHKNHVLAKNKTVLQGSDVV